MLFIGVDVLFGRERVGAYVCANNDQCHLADAFIQSDLQLIRLSRRHTPWSNVGLRALLKGPTAVRISSWPHRGSNRRPCGSKSISLTATLQACKSLSTVTISVREKFVWLIVVFLIRLNLCLPWGSCLILTFTHHVTWHEHNDREQTGESQHSYCSSQATNRAWVTIGHVFCPRKLHSKECPLIFCTVL